MLAVRQFLKPGVVVVDTTKDSVDQRGNDVLLRDSGTSGNVDKISSNTAVDRAAQAVQNQNSEDSEPAQSTNVGIRVPPNLRQFYHVY